MPEDQQPNPNQPEQTPSQPAGKSIDGVQLMPKLSGENQQHHLQEVQPQPQQAPVQEPPGQQPQAMDSVKPKPSQPDQPPKTKLRPQPKPKNSNFPYAAVTMAIIIGAALIGLAVYLQINSLKTL